MTTTKDKIVSALKEGEASFSYTKSDGSTRQARGTLNPTLLPESQRSRIESVDTSGNMITYWDMERNDFRQFNSERAAI